MKRVCCFWAFRIIAECVLIRGRSRILEEGSFWGEYGKRGARAYHGGLGLWPQWGSGPLVRWSGPGGKAP